MGLDRRLNNRYVEQSAQLKRNKITIDKGKPSKKKGRDADITVESPEFQLLVKLFVPSKLLIHNNRVSQKELSTYLPIIIDSSFPALNFELHIFLSSIVTSYVSSWYALKLNTENFEFLEAVYNTICEFVKDLARRILEIMALPRLLTLLNKWAYILDSHIRQVQSENGLPQFAKQELAGLTDVIFSKDDLTLQNLTSRFLEKSHVIFQTEQNINPDESHKVFNSDITIEEDELDEANGDTCLRLVYLRLVVKSVVIAAFDRTETESLNTPVSSTIAMNLISLALADLVLDRVILKLSSPQFILQTVVGKMALTLQDQLGKKEEKIHSSLIERAKHLVTTAYKGLSSSWSLVYEDENEPILATPLVFFSPFLSLIDGITNVCSRKPILTSILSIWRSIITSNSYLSGKIETAIGRYIIDQTRQSHFLQDEAQASIVRQLREIVFGNEGPVNPKHEAESIEELAVIWLKILSTDATSLLPMGISLQSFRYKNESSEDLRKCVERFLLNFDESNCNPKGPFSEKSDLNKLLIIRLFDSVIQCLYPELVETIAITV